MLESILLFLYSNNFMTLANYIALLLFAYCIWNSRGVMSFYSGGMFGLLIFSSFSYLVIYVNNYGMPDLSQLFMRFIGPVLLFYVGSDIANKGEEHFKNAVLIVAFGMCTHGFLNVITNYGTDVLTVEGRQYQDIYGGSISATIQNLFFIMCCALLIYFLFYENRRVIKLLGIGSVFAGIYGTIANASRTLLLVTLIVALCALLYHFIIEDSFASGILRWITLVIAIGVLVLFVIWADLFGIQELFSMSSLGRRMSGASTTASISQNLRWKYASDILKLLPSYPMGDVPYEHYAHNLWVDIAKEAGVIPFILYIAFTIGAIVMTIRFLKNQYISTGMKVMFSSLIFAFCMAFFTEPVLEGSPLVFSAFCMVIGGGYRLSRDPTTLDTPINSLLE